MKKLLDRAMFWFGYVPVGVLHTAIRAGDDEVQAVKADRLRVVWEAEKRERELQRRYAGTTSARAAELAAVTKRLEVVS